MPVWFCHWKPSLWARASLQYPRIESQGIVNKMSPPPLGGSGVIARSQWPSHTNVSKRKITKPLKDEIWVMEIRKSYKFCDWWLWFESGGGKLRIQWLCLNQLHHLQYIEGPFVRSQSLKALAASSSHHPAQNCDILWPNLWPSPQIRRFLRSFAC